MDRTQHILFLFISLTSVTFATENCTQRKVQVNLEEESDDVMLLAMPQRPRPARKVISRSRPDTDVTSLFQVDEISTPAVVVKVEGEETLLSQNWILILASVLLFILLLAVCALQNVKEDASHRELRTLVGRLTVKSAEDILNQFESPADSSLQKLGMTRIQGRVVAKNAQAMATPFSDQQCVMYSASASQQRQDGVHQPPLAYHAACSDFAIELDGPTPLQISVHGHDVSLFQMSHGRFCKEASFSDVPEPWRGFALAHLIHGVDASCNAMSCVDLGAQGALEFCESALLHGSRVTCVGEVVRDRNGELSLCPWRPLVEGLEATCVEKNRMFPLQFSATSWESPAISQLNGQVLISDNPQFFQNALWRWMGGHSPAATLLNA